MKYCKFYLISIFFFLILSSRAQNSWNTSLVGHWGYGPCIAVSASGNYALAGSGLVLLALDISNPSIPIKVGEVLLPDIITAIACNGNHVYVADYSAGLRIINIDNIAEPYEEGYYDTPGYALGIAVSGNYAYIGDYGTGLRIINVSNPLAPFEEGFYDTPGMARGVVVSGDYAYVADKDGGLRIINVSSPSAPFEVGHYSLSSAYGVALSGDYAYVICNTQYLWIINVSNPSAPVLETNYSTPGITYGITISGIYAFVTDGNQGMRIINIGSPSSPYEEGHFEFVGNTIGVFVSGNYAYLACHQRGMRIVNVSNPSAPFEAGHFDTPYQAIDITVAGNYAYLGDKYNGLRIINISDPSDPYQEGFFPCPGDAFGIAVSGNYAYLAALQYLYILDITNPSAPYQVGSCTVSYSSAIAIAGDYAYIGVGGYGLRIVNISDPASPYVVGSYNTYEYVNSVKVSGDYVYLAVGISGLLILDVNDPSSPILIGDFNTDGSAEGIDISGNYAYVADDLGLQIIDITNPSFPTEEGFLSTPGYALGVSVSGCHAFIAGYSSGLRVINISNPQNPYEEGYYITPSWAMNIDVVGNYSYIADNEAGLMIIQTEIPPELNITPVFKNVSYLSGTFQIIVNANIDWAVDESCDWLNCYPNSGSECGLITVFYEENPDADPRSCTISVSGNGFSSQCLVNQSSAPAFLNLNPTSQNVGWMAGNFTADITSNLTWTVTDTCSWLSCSPTSGNGNGSITVNYEENPYNEPRSCTIILSGSGLNSECVVNQELAPGFLNLSPTNQNVGWMAGDFTIEVSSNIIWSVTDNCSWLECIPETGTGNGEITVNYDENTSINPRVCTITVTGSGLIYYCDVTQDGTVSINEFSENKLCFLYPNPFKNEIIVTINLPEASTINLSLFNQVGTKVKGINMNITNPREKEFVIETGSIPAGIYFYRLEANSVGDHYSFSGKLLKK